MPQADRFLNACRREPCDVTPIWLMKQTGPHLPTYRNLLEQYGFATILNTPELAAQATCMPVDEYGVDAAILCSDILLVLDGLGLDVCFVADQGAVIRNPIRSHADIESLVLPPVASVHQPVLEAIRQSARELHDRVPVIGLSAAPFTLASYAIEGCLSKHYKLVKAMMYSDQEWWDRLMTKLTRQAAEFLIAQAEAGAQALQLFDSWVGALSPYDFREYVLPYSQRLVKHVKTACPEVPLISFGTRGVGFLPLFREVGGDVIGIDWRIDLLDAWQQLGDDVAVQGNLDPALLLGPVDVVESQAARLLDAVNGRPGHIMNVGHGLFKETPPETIRALVDFVHEHTTGLPE